MLVKLTKGSNNIQIKWQRGRKTLQKCIVNVNEETNLITNEANLNTNEVKQVLDEANQVIEEANLNIYEARVVTEVQAPEAINELNLTIDDFREELEQGRISVEYHNAFLHNLNVDIAVVEEAVADLSQGIADIRQDIAKIKQYIEEHNINIAGLRQSIANLRQKFAKISQDIAHHRQASVECRNGSLEQWRIQGGRPPTLLSDQNCALTSDIYCILSEIQYILSYGAPHAYYQPPLKPELDPLLAWNICNA